MTRVVAGAERMYAAAISFELLAYPAAHPRSN